MLVENYYGLQKCSICYCNLRLIFIGLYYTIYKIKQEEGRVMKGTVVATWIQTAKKLWGEDAVAAVMKRNGWAADRIFLPLEDVDD